MKNINLCTFVTDLKRFLIKKVTFVMSCSQFIPFVGFLLYVIEY